MPPFNRPSAAGQKRHRQRKAAAKRAVKVQAATTKRSVEAVESPGGTALPEVDIDEHGHAKVANEKEAKSVLVAAAVGALPTDGHKLPVKARALGLSGKQLRKYLKRAKAALRDQAAEQSGEGADDADEDGAMDGEDV